MVALVLLVRSMNKHLRKVPAAFPAEDQPAARPAERRTDEPADEA